MTEPLVMLPTFPPGYVNDPKGFLSWRLAEQRLAESLHYWICSVRPNGRPHSIPKWGVWLDDKFYFDGSPQTRNAKNIAENPFVSIHLESGENVLILEGAAVEMQRTEEAFRVRLAEVYTAKYVALDYSPEPHYWENGGLYEVTPHTVLAWTAFTEDPTKFVFSSAE